MESETINTLTMRDFASYLADLFSFSHEAVWVLQIFIAVSLTLLVHLVAGLLMKRFTKKLSKTDSPWDDALFDALRKPFSLLILIIGIGYIIEVLRQKTQTELLISLEPVRDVAVLMTIAWFVLRFINKVEQNIVSSSAGKAVRVDAITADAISKLLRMAVIITSILVAMQMLGVKLQAVLAFGGIGGIAIGFAAKDLLSNFFGALMIYFDRPFKPGDWVRSPDRDIEGTVEYIGWRQTRIRTFSKRPIYVPNSVFSSIVVENPSRMSHRRIYEYVGIRYADMPQLYAIVNSAREMLTNHNEIDERQTLMVHFDKFSDSSIDFFIYCFTKTTDWQRFHAVKEDILFNISDIIAEHGAEIAFPTRSLYMENSVAFEPFDSGNGKIGSAEKDGYEAEETDEGEIAISSALKQLAKKETPRNNS